MNSLWNKNRTHFTQRFPELSAHYVKDISALDALFSADELPETLWQEHFPFWKIMHAKNGSITVMENGALLHSAYNPEQEAHRTASRCSEKTSAVFYSFGLGYCPHAFAEIFPDKPLILVEPDAAHFFAALTLYDWTTLFLHARIVLALACPPETVVSLIGQNSVQQSAYIGIQAQMAHAAPYFSALQTVVERNRRAAAVNTATLERFARRWQKNSIKNIHAFETCSGVVMYHTKAAPPEISAPLPALVLAAGPSLQDVLPHLAALKERSVVIAVDTALRACSTVGVHPDFIVLTDPQYYAYQHIAGLSAPESVLIAESAVYPAVFRFPCKRIVLCSSLFPLGAYFERFLGKNGDLGSGGSVASAAWNFARFIGASEIFCAGLDLAFPRKQTHIRGSTFEQHTHAHSMRTAPAETAGSAALYSPLSETGTDYHGNPVATDRRMKLFAWWFESHIAACPEVKTYTFSADGLAVPGIMPTAIETLLTRPAMTKEKQQFFAASEQQNDTAAKHERFTAARSALIGELRNIQRIATRALALCTKAARAPHTAQHSLFAELNDIDRTIQASDVKEIVSLVFPTERQLEARYNMLPDSAPAADTPLHAAIQKSKIIYEIIIQATDDYLSLLHEQQR